MLSDLEKKELKEKWIVKSLPDTELEKIALGIYEDKIFSSMDLTKDKIEYCFSGFKYWKPNKPMELGINDYTNSKSGNRKSKIFDLLHKDTYLQEYSKKMDTYNHELKYYNESYKENVGMLYEYIFRKNEILSLNEYPYFSTFNLLNKKDSKKVIEYYNLLK